MHREVFLSEEMTVILVGLYDVLWIVYFDIMVLVHFLFFYLELLLLLAFVCWIFCLFVKTVRWNNKILVGSQQLSAKLTKTYTQLTIEIGLKFTISYAMVISFHLLLFSSCAHIHINHTEKNIHFKTY